MQFDSTKKPTRKDFIDLTGHKYGLLTVNGYAGRKGTNRFWHCVCDCGGMATVYGGSLRNGHASSCGCKSGFKPTHGMTHTAEYGILHGIKRRCCSPSEPGFARYGALGVTICEAWLHGEGGLSGFEVFLRDMGPRPSPRHSVDRIDPTGPYDKENCRWATPKEQGRNRRKHAYLEYKGRKMLMIEWAEERNIQYPTLHRRINVYGWTVAEALEFVPRVL